MAPSTNHYRTIIVSDMHLGCNQSSPSRVESFLKRNTCDHLILNGDVIDMWKIENHTGKLRPEHVRALAFLYGLADTGTEVTYITGNHDEFLRVLTPTTIGKVSLVDSIVHVGADGRRRIVIHGDQFDLFSTEYKMVAKVADYFYAYIIAANAYIDKATVKMGKGHGHLAKFVKQSTKRVAMVFNEFEARAIHYAKTNGYDGIVCGHIHIPCRKVIEGIEYYNCGDFMESNTALVEDHQGRWAIVSVMED